MLDRVQTPEKPPKGQQWHLWADWAELLCLMDVDGVLGKSQQVDRLKGGRDTGDISPAALSDEKIVRMNMGCLCRREASDR